MRLRERRGHPDRQLPGHRLNLSMKEPALIPAEINGFSRMEAARFYVDRLGWAVHPLLPSDRGDDHERGKKPILKGWRNHTAGEISPDFLAKYFANGSTHNVGCVVRAPYVHVDLDSKPDGGESVQKWLASQPELLTVPRERTGGGAHLVFICRDIPELVLKAKKAPSVRINDAVSAELFFDGLNIVLTPSTHKSGHHYSWEVTGAIPEVSWKDLCRWFGFIVPEAKKRGRPGKEKPWWAKWKEDLRTLDLVGVMRELGHLGECLDPDEDKWAVRCPWEAEHTGGKALGTLGSATVVFNRPETMPAFYCLHSHCEARTLEGLIEWIEERRPGIVAECCADLRAWTSGATGPVARARILLPAVGRSHSEFGAELGNAIAPSLDIFRYSQTLVEIVDVPVADSAGSIPGHMFSVLRAADLVTAAERTVETGVLRKDDAGDIVFRPKSMTEQDARVTLSNGFFLNSLPRITRVLDVPVPMRTEGHGLVYPVAGYDERYKTWLSPDAPKLRTMGVDEALDLLVGELFCPPDQGGFWWHDEQAQIHALARLITPFCRGLMGWKRSPLWIFDGNREGCGKDTCADATHLLYTGRSIICAPLSKNCDEEMRKRITAALLAGSRFFHLANMKGHVRYASLEAATDNSGVWEDRRLGVSETLFLPNETEYSFSANNATWEPDIERRCRRIRLRFVPEEINAHRYRHEDLRGWILKHRSELLSAVAALAAHWMREGRPPGPTPFTSFPEWGHVVGGIVSTCGVGDPCLPHEDSHCSGDQDTRAMREFFALAHDRFGDKRIPKPEFQEFVQGGTEVRELFDWIDFETRKGQTTFGKLVMKFDGRELGRILLTVHKRSKNRRDYQFIPLDNPESPRPPRSPELFPSASASRDRERGREGDGGHANSGDISGKNAVTNTEKEKTFTGAYIGEIRISPDSPKSLVPVICTTRDELERIAADLTGADRIALDLETYGSHKGDGLDPWKGDIRLLTLGRHGGTIWIIDLMAIGYDLGPLAPALETAGIVAHNAKFDLLWLRVKCGLRFSKVHCTLTAARLLVAGTKPGNKLDQCLQRYLQIEPGNDQSRSDWGSMLLSEEQIIYAARDVAYLHDLLGVLESEIEMAGLEEVWLLESKLLPCVVAMESAGIEVDREKLKKIALEAKTATSNAADNLCRALKDPAINPASPAQLLPALRGAGIRLKTTAEEDLKAANDGHLVPMVLAFRGASKRAQQAEALVRHIRGDGRIHARFEPTGTETGRFSSQDPNLQNVGRGELREPFIAPAGRCLVVADYSQVELRAAAAIAGETRMIEAYEAGEDLHRKTAAAVLGVNPGDVNKSQRQLAKAVNFGLLYGQSATGLVRYAATSYGVVMTADEAKSIRTAFFRTYTRLRQWHGVSRRQAQDGVKEVRTRLGRRRLIPPTASEWERFTALVNTTVQGGCADGMKEALVALAERLPAGARILSTVHDEVIVEAPEAAAEMVLDLVIETMREAMAALFPEVPIEVEGTICCNWGGKK